MNDQITPKFPSKTERERLIVRALYFLTLPPEVQMESDRVKLNKQLLELNEYLHAPQHEAMRTIDAILG